MLSVSAAVACGPPVTDYLHLSYRPDLHRLVGRWQRPASAAEVRQGYRDMLELARQVGCPYWLLDLRGRNAPDASTLHWLRHKFLPRLPERLGHPAWLGYLLSPTLLRELGQPLTAASRIAFFADEGAVGDWLSRCQER